MSLMEHRSAQSCATEEVMLRPLTMNHTQQHAVSVLNPVFIQQHQPPARSIMGRFVDVKKKKRVDEVVAQTFVLSERTHRSVSCATALCE